MTSWGRCLGVLCTLALSVFVCNAQPVSVIELELDGMPFSSDQFDVGRYALTFVIPDGCPACEGPLTWLQRAAEAFPEIRFLLASPVPLGETTKMTRNG